MCSLLHCRCDTRVLGAPWLSAGLAAKTASEMTYSVSSGALNSTPTNQPMLGCCHFCCCSRLITSEWKMADNAEMIVDVRARGFIAMRCSVAERKAWKCQRTYTEMLGN